MLLNFIGCVIFGFLMWKLGRNSCLAANNKPKTKPSNPEPPEALIYVEMVCCEYCGLNFPIEEAVEREGKIYCCAQHAILAQQTKN